MGGPVVIKHAPKALTVDDLSLAFFDWMAYGLEATCL